MVQDWVFTAAAGLVAGPAFLYSILRTPREEAGGDDGSQKTFGMARVGDTPLLDFSYLSPNKNVKILAKAEFRE